MENHFSSMYERDMDVLFMGLFQTDENYVRFVLERAEIPFKTFEVLSVELSHTEVDLGESDITVRIRIDDQIHGLLIEDKIDAIAMKNQHERYIKRGAIGIQKGYYQVFHDFIFCPRKYWEKDSEAKEYTHSIFYEDFAEFCSAKTDSLSQFRRSQFESAIEQAKNPPQVILNERANAFYRKYHAYQQEHFPSLWLRTKTTSNGYWAHYNTAYRNAYILHKIQEGYVDLTLPRCAEKMAAVQRIAEWLSIHGVKNLTACTTGKAASLRITVQKLDIMNAFELVPQETIDECFEAVSELSKLTSMLEDFRSLLNNR